jgi:ankyrin repeat protein
MRGVIPFVLFLLSNNLSFFLDDEEVEDTNDPDWHLRIAIREDHLNMGILHLSGLNDPEIMKHLLRLEGVTAETIAERLFASAVRTRNLKIVETMLQAGIDPEMVFFGGEDEEYEPMFLTALEFAAAHYCPNDSVKIAHILSLHNATQQPGRDSSALKLAIMKQNEQLVRFLAERGSRVSSDLVGKCLEEAESFKMARICLEFCVEIDERIEFSPKYRRENTITTCFRGTGTLLGLVAENESLFEATVMAEHLLARGANVDALQALPLESFPREKNLVGTALGFAAAKGNLRLMTILLEAGAKFDLEGVLGCLSPLMLAVCYHQRDAAELLVKWGASTEKMDKSWTQIGRTKLSFKQAMSENRWLCRLLLKGGYNLRGQELAQFCSANLRTCIRENDAESIQRLLKIACLDEASLCWVSYSLVAAIDQGNCHIISLLWEAGARSDPRLISSIGNLETAVFLDQLGVLRSLLRTNGQWILTTAIMAENETLVDFLLQHSADYSSNSSPTNISQLDTLLEVDRSPLSLYNNKYDCYKDFVKPGRLCTTPLEAALCRGNFQLAWTLLVRGAPVKEGEINAVVWNAINREDFSPAIEFLNVLCSVHDLPCAPTAIRMALSSGNQIFARFLLKSGVGVVGTPYLLSADSFVLDKYGTSVFTEHDWLMAGWWNWVHCDETQPVIRGSYIHLISILEMAVKNSELSTFQTLLQFGAWTPEELGNALVESLKHDRKEFAPILLASGASLQGRGLSSSPLGLEVNKTDVQSVNYLILAGCNLDHIFGSQESSLRAAIMHEKVALVETFLAGGVDINEPTDLHPNGGIANKGSWYPATPTNLQRAVEKEDENLVEMLLTAGADVNPPASFYQGRTALQISVEKENLKLAERLLRAGANVNGLAAPKEGSTPFKIAVQQGHRGLMDMLLMAGADVNSPATWDSSTALQIAVTKGSIDLTQWLLGIGANVNGAPGFHSGRTALQAAVLQGNIELMDMLLEKGADVNQSPADYHGATALQFAAIRGYIGIAQKLIDRGANINAARGRHHGRTALEGAAEYGRIDMLQLLWNEGFCPEGEGRRSLIRAVKLAVENKRHATARYLKSFIDWNDLDTECYRQEIFGLEEEDFLGG